MDVNQRTRINGWILCERKKTLSAEKIQSVFFFVCESQRVKISNW
jgi:hypothetical protein